MPVGLFHQGLFTASTCLLQKSRHRYHDIWQFHVSSLHRLDKIERDGRCVLAIADIHFSTGTQRLGKALGPRCRVHGSWRVAHMGNYTPRASKASSATSLVQYMHGRHCTKKVAADCQVAETCYGKATSTCRYSTLLTGSRRRSFGTASEVMLTLDHLSRNSRLVSCELPCAVNYLPSPPSSC